MIHHVRTIDAHVGGAPLRLVIEGFPEPPGATMLDKGLWLRRHRDGLRRALMLEPRGHADMCGAVLTSPVRPDSDAGVLFMQNDGYSTMCGHGVIAVATLVVERGLRATLDPTRVVLDTPAGRVVATPQTDRGAADAPADPRPNSTEPRAGPSPRRVTAVSVENVPSFVVHAGLPVRAANRPLRVDVAFGGAFYAIVDAEAAGLPLETSRLPDLRRVGTEIARAVEAAQPIAHPLDPRLAGIRGTIFTGPARDPHADLRSMTVVAGGAVDRSPGGTGTCAVIAVLDGMNVLPRDRPFTHEGPLGTTFRVCIVGRAAVGEYPAVVAELGGSAWTTGEHHFLVDDADPLREGFRI
jgi:trans-L-3-hydroxyproline dehydratase